MNKFAQELGQLLARRQYARAGRLVKSREAMSRELHEAGESKPTGRTFSYPKGCKMAQLMKIILSSRKD